jgi:beta-phosphoglucomutase-like phosphatase (HAD superfamily)
MALRYSRARGVTFEAVTRTGLAVAVVSSSANTRQVLEVTGLDKFVQKRVDGVALRKKHIAGKPAPDSYLEGARQLVADVVVTDLAELLDGE